MIIGFDEGHTIKGPNYGAVGLIKESEETRVLGRKIKSNLKAMGHTVVDCTVNLASSNLESLKKRVINANKQKIDLFVSLHFNAGGGTGTEVLTYGAKRLVQAEKVLSNMEKIGFKNRGVKNGSRLYVIKNTNASAMLIETCFVDNQSDVNLYRNNIDKIAATITEGITGQTINKIGDDEYMIPGTVKLAACIYNPIAQGMIDQIKLLEGLFGLKKDGIATEELISKLPIFKGGESKGSASIIQDILWIKGYMSYDEDKPPLGPAFKDAIAKFKKDMGIPESKVLVDELVWRKLLEY